jgi:hypothetical protein
MKGEVQTEMGNKFHTFGAAELKVQLSSECKLWADKSCWPELQRGQSAILNLTREERQKSWLRVGILNVRKVILKLV